MLFVLLWQLPCLDAILEIFVNYCVSVFVKLILFNLINIIGIIIGIAMKSLITDSYSHFRAIVTCAVTCDVSTTFSTTAVLLIVLYLVLLFVVL